MNCLTLLIGMVLAVESPPDPPAPQTSSLRGPFFRGLGDLPGGTYRSQARDVSSHGIVVGASRSEKGEEAFRWTPEEGMQGLGDLPNGQFGSQAHAISSDGTRIVGFGSTVHLKNPYCTEAFLWTESQGMKGLGNLAGIDVAGTALSLSSDGRVIVGIGFDEDVFESAVSWTKGTGPVRLFDPARPRRTSRACKVSEDGSVIVGYVKKGTGSESYRSASEAFRWTVAEGVVRLSAPPGTVSSMAVAASGDGSVIVGSFSDAPNTWRAYRWAANEGMIELPNLVGGFPESYATDVSADGSVVVGSSFGPEKIRSAVIWDREKKPRRIVDVLREKGLQKELDGWLLLQATGISPDGRFVVGDGENPKKRSEGWIVSLW